MNDVDITALLQKRQVQFIETRTKIESEVTNFLRSLETLDSDIRSKIGYTETKTVKDFLPELWSEPFDIEVYNEQLRTFNELVSRVRSVCDEINKEALRCLMES